MAESVSIYHSHVFSVLPHVEIYCKYNQKLIQFLTSNSPSMLREWKEFDVSCPRWDSVASLGRAMSHREAVDETVSWKKSSIKVRPKVFNRQ